MIRNLHILKRHFCCAFPVLESFSSHEFTFCLLGSLLLQRVVWAQVLLLSFFSVPFENTALPLLFFCIRDLAVSFSPKPANSLYLNLDLLLLLLGIIFGLILAARSLIRPAQYLPPYRRHNCIASLVIARSILESGKWQERSVLMRAGNQGGSESQSLSPMRFSLEPRRGPAHEGARGREVLCFRCAASPADGTTQGKHRNTLVVAALTAGQSGTTALCCGFPSLHIGWPGCKNTKMKKNPTK